MIGIGTMINSVSIVAGGLAGCFVGKLFKPDQQESVNKACGISVIFIAIAGAMQGMLEIQEGSLVSGKSMLVVLCLAIGTIFGELLGIENGFERFGEWLKNKTGNTDDITDVVLLKAVVLFLAHLVDLDEQLDTAGGILQVAEHDLALTALGHQTAGDTDGLLLIGVVVGLDGVVNLVVVFV